MGYNFLYIHLSAAISYALCLDVVVLGERIASPKKLKVGKTYANHGKLNKLSAPCIDINALCDMNRAITQIIEGPWYLSVVLLLWAVLTGRMLFSPQCFCHII